MPFEPSGDALDALQALQALRALREPAGRRLVDAAVEGLDQGVDLLGLATSLRMLHQPDLVGPALTQARLRIRARSKFGALADRMYWTAAGLEQSTRASVARLRAQRYARLPAHHVADLGCGVGGDLTALAAAGVPVTGFELDTLTAAVASANLEELALTAFAEVHQLDLMDADLDSFDAAFLDPARRLAGGRRRFDPEAYVPPFSYALTLSRRITALGLKVAPGIPHDLVPPAAEAEWVSVDDDVKEAALWFGPLTDKPGRRRATLLTEGQGGEGEVPVRTLLNDPGLGPPALGPPGPWLHEPDGAVIRAGLVAEVAAELGGWLLDPAIAYISTDSDKASAYTHRYAVEDVMPFQLKRLRATLRQRGAGNVVVKKRGSAVEPEELRRRLQLSGNGPTQTLVLTRIGTAPVVLFVRPAPG